MMGTMRARQRCLWVCMHAPTRQAALRGYNRQCFTRIQYPELEHTRSGTGGLGLRKREDWGCGSR